jgi:putative DNA primase/helicase
MNDTVTEEPSQARGPIRYLIPIFENIPADLTARPQWVNWRFERRNGKPTKRPVQPDGSAASATDPATWSPFDFVRTAYETANEDPIFRRRFCGVGFVLTDADPFVAFDFDHCLDVKFNIIDPRVAEFVRRLNSYTEITPSGCGLRVIVHAKLPPQGRKLGNFECYAAERFVTLTGCVLE